MQAYVRIRKYMHIQIYTHIHTHMLNYIHTHTHKHMDLALNNLQRVICHKKTINQPYTHIYSYVHVCVCVRVCVCVCVCVCANIQSYHQLTQHLACM